MINQFHHMRYFNVAFAEEQDVSVQDYLKRY